MAAENPLFAVAGTGFPLVTAATPLVSNWFEGEPGDILYAGVLVESLNGAPTACTLVAQWQARPIAANLFNINTESSTVTRPWVPVLAADTFLGAYVQGGDWPNPILSATTYQSRGTAQSATAYAAVSGTYPQTNGPTGTIMVERGFQFGALARQVRLVLAATFTGGTSPSWSVTGMARVLPKT